MKLGILDAIVEWISSSIMGVFDYLTVAVANILDCDLSTFERVFHGVGTTYVIFQGIAIGLILLNFIMEVFKSMFAPMGIESEDPIKVTLRSGIFLFLVINVRPIMDMVLEIGETPYKMIANTDFESVSCTALGNAFYTIVSVVSNINGITLILIVILLCVVSWNYFKLLLNVVKAYVMLGLLFFTAPLPFAMGAAKGTAPIFSSWCRTFGGQLMLLILNVWVLKIFTSMIETFMKNPFIVMG